VGQGAVDEVGEGGFDDGVAAVGDIGVGGRLGGVGEERVIPPDREQCGSPEIVEGFLCRFRLGRGFPDLVVDGR
jgi:hypothetical protein